MSCVSEAARGEVLAPREALLPPSPDDMTPRVRVPYERLYPAGRPAGVA